MARLPGRVVKAVIVGRTRVRDVWLAIRLRVDCAESEDETVKAEEWLVNALHRAEVSEANSGITVASPPIDIVDTAVRALRQAETERERLR